ncbi:glycine cleavage system T protein [Desulforamulus reducens MI-1]|uniref:Aminomethyltransferase n=1 Tax=Desulforamulus reducens (strain ATCC BAA-1160 / DSM 100696 / MI-1) TaxID=349161 RepID=GCST_DESRM|nr:glycine cleavage system aminomethyltransferase GcvT [Desulforamulus reducens]A4J2F6.1 RecName: Full=Aminomethyltransferase; AltName: Full=Glycine cleavage system T protein [Desulforamulus reducens MI-1]ABO49259.1 glycine cleavage system T protein [Desulforamulus reducens MI-1]
MQELKRTPLYNIHLAAGAKMVEFGGWLMPVQYEGIIAEHQAVRSAAGLFDVSHMGEIQISGPTAREFVQRLVTNDISRLKPGCAIYSPMCNPQGGTVDDLLVYQLEDQQYLLVVNASNTDKDFHWIVSQQVPGVEIQNVSEVTCQLALQGPQAEKILQRLTAVDLSHIKSFCFVYGAVEGIHCLISRTGYTGEAGFELYFPASHAERVWQAIMATGATDGLRPVGLGARDTLRFEACLALYGHELTDDISPLMAGLGWTVKFNKPEFVGKEPLLKQKEAGTTYQLVGLEMIDRGIPRQGYAIFKEGQEVGWITSGTFAPTLGKNMGLGYVEIPFADVGKELNIMVRNKPLKARIVKKPFYKREV